MGRRIIVPATFLARGSAETSGGFIFGSFEPLALGARDRSVRG